MSKTMLLNRFGRGRRTLARDGAHHETSGKTAITMIASMPLWRPDIKACYRQP